jgi:hypothetical protein
MYANVFSKINKGMDPKLAVKKIHEEFGFNTAMTPFYVLRVTEV